MRIAGAFGVTPTGVLIILSILQPFLASSSGFGPLVAQTHWTNSIIYQVSQKWPCTRH